jgi:hypothetical protein
MRKAVHSDHCRSHRYLFKFPDSHQHHEYLLQFCICGCVSVDITEKGDLLSIFASKGDRWSMADWLGMEMPWFITNKTREPIATPMCHCITSWDCFMWTLLDRPHNRKWRGTQPTQVIGHKWNGRYIRSPWSQKAAIGDSEPGTLPTYRNGHVFYSSFNVSVVSFFSSPKFAAAQNWQMVILGQNQGWSKIPFFGARFLPTMIDG